MTDPRPMLAAAPKIKWHRRKPRVLGWLAYDADPWKIRLWRELRGKTREQVNEAMGIRRGNLWLYHLEADTRPVSHERLGQLALALDVPMSELLSDKATRAENAAEYAHWVADGRPDLRAWFGIKEGK